MASAVQGEVQVLQDIHASQEDKGVVVRERDISELYLSGHDRVAANGLVSLRGLSNTYSKSDVSWCEDSSLFNGLIDDWAWGNLVHLLTFCVFIEGLDGVQCAGVLWRPHAAWVIAVAAKFEIVLEKFVDRPRCLR